MCCSRPGLIGLRHRQRTVNAALDANHPGLQAAKPGFDKAATAGKGERARVAD